MLIGKEDPTDTWCRWCGRNPWQDEHHLFRRSTSPQMVRMAENKVKLCRRCHDMATLQKEVEELFQQVFFLKQDDPELTVEYIARTMLTGDIITPRNVARYRAYLAGQYSFLNEQFTTLEMSRPFVIEKFRKLEEVKSDKRAETLYEMTEEGQRYKLLHSQLKSLEKLLSALRSVHEQYVKESQLSM